MGRPHCLHKKLALLCILQLWKEILSLIHDVHSQNSSKFSIIGRKEEDSEIQTTGLKRLKYSDLKEVSSMTHDVHIQTFSRIMV